MIGRFSFTDAHVGERTLVVACRLLFVLVCMWVGLSIAKIECRTWVLECRASLGRERLIYLFAGRCMNKRPTIRRRRMMSGIGSACALVSWLIRPMMVLSVYI